MLSTIKWKEESIMRASRLRLQPVKSFHSVHIAWLNGLPARADISHDLSLVHPRLGRHFAKLASLWRAASANNSDGYCLQSL